jgi:hypothetical protein
MAQAARTTAKATGSTAPVLPIPKQQFLSVEYPGIIQNLDKALETLGGVEKIQEVRFLPSQYI